MEDNRPRKVVYSNGGQTKVTLIGEIVNIPMEELGDFFKKALKAGEQWAVNINNTLCDLEEKRAAEFSVSEDAEHSA